MRGSEILWERGHLLWGFSQQPYCQRAILVSWRHLPLNQVCAHTHNHSIRSGFGNQQFELEPAGHNQQDWGEYWDRFRLVFCCRFFYLLTVARLLRPCLEAETRGSRKAGGAPVSVCDRNFLSFGGLCLAELQRQAIRLGEVVASAFALGASG